ncbi:MAG TPA: glycosyl hydrolase [Ignavibacteriales bacterium]|nr:glycosyl hydrolase [Ignavibacteriales bacterium]
MKKVLLFSLWLLFGSLTLSQIPVPETGCYHAAFTPFDGHNDFEALSGKKIAIEMNYKSWGSFASFPSAEYNSIVDKGAVPHMTWEPWNGDASSTVYSNDKIINGNYDTYIKNWATQIRTWANPIFIRWGHEMNGNWYPWDGVHSGGNTLDGFGDPAKADGPERYVAAYRHIHDLFEEQGADNVVWIWCPMDSPTPNEAWNAAANYYPGDEYVDWIGIDGYNWGTTQSWSKWNPFVNIYMNIYFQLESYGKPMMVAEFASAEKGGAKASWIKDAYTMLKSAFPMIKAVTWFNINKETDWRINSSPEALAAYREAISDPYFLESAAQIGVENAQPNTAYTFELRNSYPNPFNGSVKIPFSIQKDGEYKLEIRNILGELVQTIFYKRFSPGTYEAGWDTSSEFPSGIYFVTFSSGVSIKTSKIVLMK